MLRRRSSPSLASSLFPPLFLFYPPVPPSLPPSLYHSLVTPLSFLLPSRTRTALAPHPPAPYTPLRTCHPGWQAVSIKKLPGDPDKPRHGGGGGGVTHTSKIVFLVKKVKRGYTAVFFSPTGGRGAGVVITPPREVPAHAPACLKLCSEALRNADSPMQRTNTLY